MTPESVTIDPTPKPPTCTHCGQACNTCRWRTFGEAARDISQCCLAPLRAKLEDVRNA